VIDAEIRVFQHYRRIADVADRDRGRLNWAETGPTPVAREWAGFAHSDLPLIIGQDLSRRERGENPVLQHHQHLSGDCEGVRALRTGNNAAKLARQKCRFDLLT
jgi:hypothetical protein